MSSKILLFLILLFNGCFSFAQATFTTESSDSTNIFLNSLSRYCGDSERSTNPNNVVYVLSYSNISRGGTPTGNHDNFAIDFFVFKKYSIGNNEVKYIEPDDVKGLLKLNNQNINVIRINPIVITSSSFSVVIDEVNIRDKSIYDYGKRYWFNYKYDCVSNGLTYVNSSTSTY